MFKTKEELLNKVTDDGYIGGIDDAFKSFAERVEFYLNWRYLGGNLPIEECMNKYPEVDKKWRESGLTFRQWNIWLFDYCFGDGIE